MKDFPVLALFRPHRSHWKAVVKLFSHKNFTKCYQSQRSNNFMSGCFMGNNMSIPFEFYVILRAPHCIDSVL